MLKWGELPRWETDQLNSVSILDCLGSLYMKFFLKLLKALFALFSVDRNSKNVFIGSSFRPNIIKMFEFPKYMPCFCLLFTNIIKLFTFRKCIDFLINKFPKLGTLGHPKKPFSKKLLKFQIKLNGSFQNSNFLLLILLP